MDIYKIIFAVIILALICFFLKGIKSEYSLMASLACMVLIGLIVASRVDELLGDIEEITSIGGIGLSYIKVLLKCMCISVLTDFASSFCKDSSNETLSKGVELIGKIAVFSLGFPLLKTFVKTVIGFLG